jgi:RNA-binding protein NOB1
MVCSIHSLCVIWLIIASVIQWAKKTGDYTVLSHPDLCVLALTYMLHEQGKKAKEMVVEEKKSDQASVLAIHT